MAKKFSLNNKGLPNTDSAYWEGDLQHLWSVSKMCHAFWYIRNGLNQGVTHLDWKRSSGWLESWRGLHVVCDWRFDNLCGSHLQSQVKVLVSWKFKNLTPKMASAQVVETSIKKKQSFSRLQSARWSFSIKVCYSWVQTIILLTEIQSLIFYYCHWNKTVLEISCAFLHI